MGIHIWCGVRPIRVHSSSGEWILAYPFEAVDISPENLVKRPGLSARLLRPEEYLDVVKGAPEAVMHAWCKWTRDGHPAKRATDLREVFTKIVGSSLPGIGRSEPAAPSKYDGLKLRDLRDLCKDRGLPIYGAKADVIRRLEGSDGGH